MQADSELFTLGETQQILRFSKSKLYSERRSGRLSSRRFGSRAVRIHREDLEKYIQAAASQSTQIAVAIHRRPLAAVGQ